MAIIALKCPDIKVNVVDLNEQRVKEWNSESLPIYEPGLYEIVKEVRGKGDTITLHHVHSHHTQPLLLSYSTHCPEHEYIPHYSALINGWREKGESK